MVSALVAASLGTAGAAPVATPGRPDAAAAEASDANLEPSTERSGIVPTLAFGGGFTLGFGIPNATGTGGAFALRVAEVASRRALVHVEIVAAALFSRKGSDEVSVSYRTDAAAALVGGQYYVNRSVWVRIAAGVGNYHGNPATVMTSTGPLEIPGVPRIWGVAGSVGAGFELFAVEHLHGGFEVMATTLATSDGMVTSNAMLFSISLR